MEQTCSRPPLQSSLTASQPLGPLCNLGLAGPHQQARTDIEVPRASKHMVTSDLRCLSQFIVLIDPDSMSDQSLNDKEQQNTTFNMWFYQGSSQPYGECSLEGFTQLVVFVCASGM